MKTKRLFLLLCLTLMAGSAAWAEEYIRVSNKKMSFTESWTKSSSYFNDTSGSGSVSWDAANRKLTLNKFIVWRGWEVGAGTNVKTCIEVYSTKSVTIEVVGNNYVTNGKGQTLALHGNTTFTGNGTLKFSNYDDKKPGIDLLEENIDVTVNGPTLKFECKNGGIRGKNNTGTLRVKGGEVLGSSNGKLVTGLANVTFGYGMGVKTPQGAQFSHDYHCMVDVNGKEITSQAVEIGAIKYYGFRICGVDITENNCDHIEYLKSVDGKAYYQESTNKLFLINATITNNTTYPSIENSSNDGLDIEIQGGVTFQYGPEGSSPREGLKLNANTDIVSGDLEGTYAYVVTIRSESETEGGIYIGPGKTLYLRSNLVYVPYLAGGSPSSKLDISEDVEVYASGSNKGTVRQLQINNISYEEEIAISSSHDNPCFIWNRTGNAMSGVYKDLKSFATGEVHFSTRSDVEWYPLYICGHRVNSLNWANPVNEFVESGRLFYNIVDGALNMNNVTIDYNGGKEQTGPAIKWDTRNSIDDNVYRPGLILGGTNTIRSYNGDAISSTKDLRIERLSNTSGDWSLTLVGSNAKVSTPSQLSFSKVTATLPEISAKSLVVSDSKLSVTRKMETEKDHLSDAVLCSTPSLPGYYDRQAKKVVSTKGPVNIVPRSSVTIYDGIEFCDEEINSANHTCVMNKYVDEGTLSVEKVSNGYTVSMRGIRVKSENNVNIFRFTSLGSVGLDLYEQFNTFNTKGHFIRGDAKNIYIYGKEKDGAETSLLVEGSPSSNAGAISVAANSSLYLYKGDANKVNVSVPCIYGQGTTSKLYVNDPYLYVNGNEKGTVSNITCAMTTSKVELYNTSSSPREIRSDGIYENGSLCTGQVKFVAKGESYIPVDEVRLFPPNWIFERKGQTTQLRAEIYPEDATNKNVVWASTDESVAKVDQNGKVTAVGKGQALIFGYSEDMVFDIENPSTYINACDVHVLIPEPTDITLSETEVLIDRESIGGFYLTANLMPDNAETDYFEWESSDTTLVKVLLGSGKTALVRRVGDEGQATITVKTANGLSASCNVTVHFPITPIHVDFEQRTYTLTEAGQQIKLEPIVTPDNCEKLSFTWETSSDAISLSDDGTVTARRNGSAVVECWACYDGQKYAPGEVRINVEIPPTPVIATGLKLKASDTFFYALGETAFLTPIFTPENVTNKELTWNSENPDVATVDEDGFFTIVGWGDCRITATTKDGSNIKAGYTVTAIDPSTIPDPVYATGIKLDENEVTLMRGEETRIGLTVDPANYNGDIMLEPMEGDISIAQVNMEWDWNTNRTSIYIRSEEWSEMSGDLKVRVRPNMVDWEKLNAQGIWEEPADTLTIHVLAPIIFTAASPEDIDVTYHVTDINDKTCEVYTQPRPGMTMIDPLDPDLTPAVSQTATGMLTVPAKANGYWVTNVMPCAFNRCSGLTEIDFSEGIETIGDYACYSGLFSLQRVTLPSTIKELGQYCFSANPSDYATSEDPSGRNHIREVNIKAFTPPTGLNGSDINWSGAFQQVASDAVLYVPTGALAAYNVEPWTGWFSRIAEKQFFEDPDGIKAIDNGQLTIDNEGAWFDLSGRKLGSKPAKPGLYIQGGKKVVIK